MAKRAAARAAEVSAGAAVQSVAGPNLEQALASIADACAHLAATAVVSSPVRVLSVLCDAADGDPQAAHAVASIRGSFAHASRSAYRDAYVSELRDVKAAIERKAAAAAAPADQGAPPADASGSAAAV